MTQTYLQKSNTPSNTARTLLGGSLLTAGMIVGVGVVVLGGDAPLDASTTRTTVAIEAKALDIPERLSPNLLEAKQLSSSRVATAHYEATAAELARPQIQLVTQPAASLTKSSSQGVDMTSTTPEPIWLTGRVKPVQE